jgi:hypothetical protein
MHDQPGQAYYEDVPAPDYTQPYQAPPSALRFSEPPPAAPRQAPSRLLLFCFIASIVALGLVLYSMYGPKHVDHSTARALASIQQTVKTQGQELAKAEQDLTKAQAANASLADKLASTKAKLANLTPYSQECSAPVTGPSGNPVQGFFRCSLAHQGG